MESDAGVRNEGDRAYFARRADEERSAAAKSDSSKARDAHREMAQRYQEQADKAVD